VVSRLLQQHLLVIFTYKLSVPKNNNTVVSQGNPLTRAPLTSCYRVIFLSDTSRVRVIYITVPEKPYRLAYLPGIRGATSCRGLFRKPSADHVMIVQLGGHVDAEPSISNYGDTGG
jgi:hypothetical protein